MAVKISVQKLKTFFPELLRKAAEHSFLAFIALFFIAVIIGGAIFCKYFILMPKVEPLQPASGFKFREGPYQEVLTAIENRRQRFEAADFKIYPFIFAATSTSP